jgi:WD40 repeat protein
VILGYELFKKIDGHYGSINCLLPFKKLDLIISGSSDTSIRIWNPATDLEIREMFILTGHKKAVNCLRLDLKDQIISGSDDFYIKIWKKNF